MATPPFHRVFIANRGEISRRIATTARALGVESVCITASQPPPLYLQEVITHFAEVREESPNLYLNHEAMIQLALDHNCDCLHPGFGFLSENAEFAAKVQAAGLAWIGPPATAIKAMADKAEARLIALRLQVPCTQGLRLGELVGRDGNAQLPRELLEFSRRTPYPLLVKASLGGGGKGMRLVRAEDELAEAVSKAYSEALSSFGDGSLLVEQYIEKARHIEVQILADQHGQVFAIGDRDCSLQRRHQKILEEAPAAGLTPTTRRALHTAAIALAQGVGYQSAGTVEFLLDGSAPTHPESLQPFYFLEMNTRLQVEHPVTEEVFRLDLVAWQFKIAKGHKLPPSYATLQPRGHSVEARLYGEDVSKNFFPAPGPVGAFLPYYGLGLRWEVGLDKVDEISSRFDPMIAKLVAYGEDRAQALERLKRGLQETLLLSPASNKDLLIALCGHSRFSDEVCDTGFITQQLPALCLTIAEQRATGALAASELLAWLTRSYEAGLLHPEASSGHPRPSITATTERAFQLQSNLPVPSSPQGHTALTLVERSQRAGREGGELIYGRGVQLSGSHHEGFVFAISKEDKKTIFTVLWKGYEYTFIKEKRGWQGTSSTTANDGDLIAPVPGKVVKIKVKTTDRVAKDDSLFVLESMKMEFDVRSTTAGTIVKINVTEGQQVTSGDVLAIIAAQSAAKQ